MASDNQQHILPLVGCLLPWALGFVRMVLTQSQVWLSSGLLLCLLHIALQEFPDTEFLSLNLRRQREPP